MEKGTSGVQRRKEECPLFFSLFSLFTLSQRQTLKSVCSWDSREGSYNSERNPVFLDRGPERGDPMKQRIKRQSLKGRAGKGNFLTKSVFDLAQIQSSPLTSIRMEQTQVAKRRLLGQNYN